MQEILLWALCWTTWEISQRNKTFTVCTVCCSCMFAQYNYMIWFRIASLKSNFSLSFLMWQNIESSSHIVKVIAYYSYCSCMHVVWVVHACSMQHAWDYHPITKLRYSLYNDTDSRIIKDSGKIIEAELKIGTSMMEESYISTVSIDPPKTVNVWMIRICVFLFEGNGCDIHELMW